MTILFGWYSFKIKSFTRTDLGLEPLDVDVEYQVRQRVFHFMYIPVFPVGRIFLEKAQNQLRPVSEEMLWVLEDKANVRTPWYSFSLVILLCLGVAAYFFRQGFKEYLYQKHIQEEFYSKQKQIDSELELLSKYHYVELREVDHWSASIIYYLKIEEVDASRIYATRVKSGIDVFDTPRKVRETYRSLDSGLVKVTIDKHDFEKLRLNDPDVYVNRMEYGYFAPKDCGFDLFGDGKRYVIDNVYYFNGPVLKYSGLSVNSVTGLELWYYNYGDKVRLIEIENLEGFSTKWTTELPLNVDDEHFSINAEGFSDVDEKYGVRLVFEDSLNHIFTFIGTQQGVQREPVKDKKPM